MTTSVEPFPEGQVDALAKVLGDCSKGDEIDRLFSSLGITDNSGQSTKWRRIYWVIINSQRKNNCANEALQIIANLLLPSRFAGRSADFEKYRAELNAVLLFAGLEYTEGGKFRRVEASKTLSEAERRAKTIKAKFQGRRMHAEVFKYCSSELMQKNYFHAVFEASKGLAQRIRDLSGIALDGPALVDKVFSIEHPILAFNALQTETEKSEHKGFAALLKGCFGAVRNPLAHQPKLMWEGEDDAADYLTLISLLHRKLDDCFKTNLQI